MSHLGSSLGEQASEWIRRCCPICGSGDESTVFAEANYSAERLDGFAFASRKTPDCMHYRLILCRSCDLLYASPVPPPERVVTAYRDAAFDSVTEAGYASRTYGRLLPGIVRKLPDLVGALDIGTGDGSFLQELITEGFTDVVGVEPSVAPIAAAKETIRPLIRRGVFDSEDFASDTFSLVTCFQTLEHLYDPQVMCGSAHRMLKKGGAVFFVYHDSQSLSAKLLGFKSPIFDIEHLQLFSAMSAGRLLERSGFTGISIRHIWNRYPLQYWIKLFPMPSALKHLCLSLLRVTRLDGVSVPLPVGNLAVIGYKS